MSNTQRYPTSIESQLNDGWYDFDFDVEETNLADLFLEIPKNKIAPRDHDSFRNKTVNTAQGQLHDLHQKVEGRHPDQKDLLNILDEAIQDEMEGDLSITFDE